MSKTGKSRPKTHRRGTSPRGRWRLYLFGLGAIAVVGLAAFFVLSPLRAARAPAAPAASADQPLVTQQVVLSMGGYSPSRLTAKAGQDLAVLFINPDSRFHTDGGGWHQFRIEALDVDERFPPGTQKVVTLRNLKAGTYEFYCDVCCGGKENPAMRGVLEVTG